MCIHVKYSSDEISITCAFAAYSFVPHLSFIKKTARSIAKKIEDTLDYPGQIKVNVIRESRAVEYAK